MNGKVYFGGVTRATDLDLMAAKLETLLFPKDRHRTSNNDDRGRVLLVEVDECFTLDKVGDVSFIINPTRLKPNTGSLVR